MATAAPPPSTFAERFVTMLHLCGPPSWPSLWATRADLSAAAALAERAAAGAPVAPAELLAAQRLLAAVHHPDTGAPIPLPFRMAFHVPANTVLLCGMLASKSVAGTALWQAANASFNAAQYYANRNASNEVSDAQLAASYVGAMTSSVAVGVVLRRSAARAEAAAAALAPTAWPRRLAYLASAAVPFLAAVAGKPLQIGAMRADEMTSGVVVFDEEGVPRGSSPRAGRAAVAMTIATRIVYLAPMLWLPFVGDAVCAALPVLGRSALGRGAVAVGLAATSSALVTPACLAAFDQRAALAPAQLEPRFAGLTTSAGKPVERLSFNKGL